MYFVLGWDLPVGLAPHTFAFKDQSRLRSFHGNLHGTVWLRPIITVWAQSSTGNEISAPFDIQQATQE